MNTNHNNTSFTPNKLWSTPLDHPPTAPPAITNDLLLLIPTQQPDSESQTATLHALDLSDGSPRWQHSFEYAMISGLAVTTGDHILVAITSTNVIRSQGALIALDAAGQERCRWSPGVKRVSAPTVSGDVACLTADARSLIVLDPATCQEQSRIPLETTASLSAPALAGGVVYVPCRGPNLLAIPLPPRHGGDKRGGWPFEAPDASSAWLDKTPVLVDDHLFTVLSTGEALALRTGDGSQVWRVDVGPTGKRLSAPTTDGQHLYVGARDGLHALNLADGTEAWTFSTSRRIEAAPVVTGGVVYATCRDHHTYALDAATGRELWRYELGRRIQISPALATCGETPCLLAADHGGTLVALARPLSAGEHESAGHWIEAASAYATLDQPARGAQLLEDHGEPLKAAQLWQTTGEPERAAQQYEAAGAWQQIVDLWAALDRPLKRAGALEGYARSLENAPCDDQERANAWAAAANAFEIEGEAERTAACQHEVARCLRQPVITMDVQHEGLVLNTWSSLQFIVHNEGYGPARNLVIRASRDQFEGQVMHTQRIVTLRAGRAHTAVLDVCPRGLGDFVPLRVRAEYQDHAGEMCSCEHTIHIAVASTEATRREGQTINVFVSGRGAAAVGADAVVAGAGGVAVGRDVEGDVAIGHTDNVHSPATPESFQDSVAADVEPTPLRLDAAVPDQVYLNRSFDLAVAVRRSSSPTLTEADLTHVQSRGMQVSWPQAEPYVRLRVQVSAPECEIHGSDDHSFRLYAGQDSSVFYFHLTPKKLGEIGIIVRVYQEGDWLGSARVHTIVREQVVGSVQINVTSHDIRREMIKILFLAANPADTTRLRLDQESRAIDQALRQAEFRDKFDIEQHWAVRATDLQGYLLRHQPDIVHFSGHGGPSSEIILEDNAGNSHPVAVRALSTLFSVLKDNVRCVVLNACFSEQQARAIAEHIDCVVGMSTAIGDAAAINFATAFYQALGFGRDVKTAFDLGCVQIDLANLDEQDTPQLLALKGDPGKIQFVYKDTN